MLYRSALISNKGYCNRLAFFTNVKNLPTVDGVDFGRFLRKIRFR